MLSTNYQRPNKMFPGSNLYLDKLEYAYPAKFLSVLRCWSILPLYICNLFLRWVGTYLEMFKDI